ncbi:hypothetical protein BH10ACT6_BH10ACT6_09430 [soil metagenome]
MAAERPELPDIAANVMLTQLPDGTLLAGDSHHYGLSHASFLAESTSDTLLAEIRRPLDERCRG